VRGEHQRQAKRGDTQRAPDRRSRSDARGWREDEVERLSSRLC
jgi:hypothetical protein